MLVVGFGVECRCGCCVVFGVAIVVVWGWCMWCCFCFWFCVCVVFCYLLCFFVSCLCFVCWLFGVGCVMFDFVVWC